MPENDLTQILEGLPSPRRVSFDPRLPTIPSGTTTGHTGNVFKTANLLDLPVPDNVLKFRQAVRMNEKHTQAGGIRIYVREALPPNGNYAKGDILMLHGQSFTSANWLEHNTLQTLAAAGYRVFAVDLPGYGQTGGPSVAQEMKIDFIRDLIINLNLHRPVLVSPSMSGTFTIPFVMQYERLLSAYVPIAPVGSNVFSQHQYMNVQVPTLLVYGSRDTSLGIASASNLKHLHNGRMLKLDNAGHAAYLNQPDAFHAALLNFLDLVKTHHHS